MGMTIAISKNNCPFKILDSINAAIWHKPLRCSGVSQPKPTPYPANTTPVGAEALFTGMPKLVTTPGAGCNQGVILGIDRLPGSLILLEESAMKEFQAIGFVVGTTSQVMFGLFSAAPDQFAQTHIPEFWLLLVGRSLAAEFHSVVIIDSSIADCSPERLTP